MRLCLPFSAFDFGPSSDDVFFWVFFAFASFFLLSFLVLLEEVSSGDSGTFLGGFQTSCLASDGGS